MDMELFVDGSVERWSLVDEPGLNSETRNIPHSMRPWIENWMSESTQNPAVFGDRGKKNHRFTACPY